MSASTTRNGRLKSAVSGAVGLVLVGIAATPAHAESIRSREWHLTVMKAEQMWKSSTGKGITVAVIDTGVNDDLPDLRGQVLPGKDEAPAAPGDERTDPNGHGTIMALEIAGTGKANGGNGTFGLAPGAKILPIRVPDRGFEANKYPEEFNDTVSRGIRYAADSGAQIINISLRSWKTSEKLTAAVKYALDKGSLIFAGTGNKGTRVVEYPAGTPGVVGVGAIGRDLHKTEESQYGPQVDVSAPGDEMYHACGGGEGDLCRSHGTSDATAIASASAALIWSKHPNWTNNQVLRVMLNTIGGPTDGAKRNDSVGYGLVRPRIALKDPGDPGPADVYPLSDFKYEDKTSPRPSSPAPSKSEPPASADAKPNAAPDDEDDDSSSTTWIAAGVTAAVLTGAVPFALSARRRRRDAAAAQAHNTWRP